MLLTAYTVNVSAATGLTACDRFYSFPELEETVEDEMSTAGTEDAPEAVHLATIEWQRGRWAGVKGKYSRE